MTVEEKPLFVSGGEALINPLYFFEELRRILPDKRRIIMGLLHNDLHGGNILYFSRSPTSLPFQIIDFGLSKKGPVGFDQAYFELWALLRSMGERDASVFLKILRRRDWPERKETPPDGTQWSCQLLPEIQKGTEKWKRKCMFDRGDDVDRQFCLSRIAAGLNWANKPVPDNWRFLALCYAGWAARIYVERFEFEKLGHLLQGSSFTEKAALTKKFENKLWKTLLDTVGRFSSRGGRYVLVAEGLGNYPYIGALGNVPWSAIIDLDPESETVGLHKVASEVLRCHRGVHLMFDAGLPSSDIDRGCIWFGVGGRSKERKLPLQLDKWVFRLLPEIQGLIQRLFLEATPTPLFIIMLPGSSLDPQAPMERLTRIGDAALMASKGEARVIVIGERDIHSRLAHDHVPISVQTFTKRLNENYGESKSHLEAAVPSAKGWAVITLDRLRILQETLLVLHSRVLEEGNDILNVSSSAFWRGNPVTLQDLAADVDLSRDITLKVTEALAAC